MNSGRAVVEYTIGELAARFGLATHVLRHWEDMGVLSPARRVAGRRVYGPAQVTRVAEILLGKDAGFSLEELRELFAAPDRGQRRKVLRAQLAQVRQRIARLTLSQTLLEHGLRCQHPDYQSCPHFQAMVLARLDGMELAQALDHD
ncbi:MerR family transcriptional regulator [Plantactinospora sp. S1510]|uniref:MerR family transcriptional regulator n=1 Tax=Plantactinospora alkalitolerans TaxID=2789879 RepID=A0ABS0GZB6_9ACTN|nr:MerR family transcriptional regulator [Plantactinospora alkalitolerans]MBF9131554.1 MerR family transcriptional regulator [Plantactinospora alkalitolerans]